MTTSASRSRSRKPVIVLAMVAVIALFRVFCGFYSIQLIGALPDGSTVIVWRAEGEDVLN